MQLNVGIKHTKFFDSGFALRFSSISQEELTFSEQVNKNVYSSRINRIGNYHSSYLEPVAFLNIGPENVKFCTQFGYSYGLRKGPDNEPGDKLNNESIIATAGVQFKISTRKNNQLF